MSRSPGLSVLVAARDEEATVGDLPAFRSVCAPGCCLRRDGEPSGVPALCSTDIHS